MVNENAVIANITEQAFMAHRMYGSFQIAGRSDSEAYALTRILRLENPKLRRRTAPFTKGVKGAAPGVLGPIGFLASCF